MTRAQAAPIYRQVANTLRARIHDGVYRAGDLIPPAAELEKTFEVSNITIRKAIDLLSQEGWVEGRRGVGTKVARQPDDSMVAIEISGNFRDWLDSASGRRFPVEQEVLDIAEASPPPRVAGILDLPEDAPLWRMRRVRRIGGHPISYHVNYGPIDLLGVISAEHLAGGRSFVEVFRERCAVAPARMEQRVEATVADIDLAGRLEIEFGDPIFFVENTYLSADGRPLEVTHLYLRGDRYIYRASIDLESGDAA